jgi:glycosyltransferase involved in cell wall biosynthesis
MMEHRETPQYAVSVVVPTYRRPGLLHQCLTSLCHQTMSSSRYEIVVVDDGLDTETTREVKSWQATPEVPAIRYLTTPRAQSGPAVARNIGWRAASSGIIAFTDDDCLPASDWLSTGAAAFDDPDVSGIWGRIIVPIPDDPTDYERNTAGLEEAPCATANCFYRTTALQAVGGFDERFTAAWREDSDLQFALMELGHHIIEVRAAVVVHPVRPATWGVSVRQQRNNVYNALLFKKHPSLYRRLIQDSPPWHYYINALALVSSTVGLLLGWSWLFGPALAVWAMSVGQFCAHRLEHTSRRAMHIVEMVVTSALIPPVAVYWRLRGALKYRVAFL